MGGDTARVMAPPACVAPAALSARDPVRYTSSEDENVASSPAPAGCPQLGPGLADNACHVIINILDPRFLS